MGKDRWNCIYNQYLNIEYICTIISRILNSTIVYCILLDTGWRPILMSHSVTWFDAGTRFNYKVYFCPQWTTSETNRWHIVVLIHRHAIFLEVIWDNFNLMLNHIICILNEFISNETIPIPNMLILLLLCFCFAYHSIHHRTRF